MPRRKPEAESVELLPDPRDQREEWDIQPGEPSRAYHWFSKYRSLGSTERSLARVISDAHSAPDQGKTKTVPTKARIPSLAQLKGYSSKFHWQDRAKAWDAHLDRLRRNRDEDAIIIASEAGAARLKAFMSAAQQPIEDLLDSLRSAEYREWYRQLSFGERWSLAERMAKLLPTLLDAQRQALGAKLDAAAIAAHSSQSGDDLGEAAGLLEMDTVERVAAVLSVLEQSGFGPRSQQRRKK